MGQEIRQDLAVSIGLMYTLQAHLEEEYRNAAGLAKVELAFIGAYAMIAFGGSFRGNAAFLMDTMIYWNTLLRRGVEYVRIPLLGKYKLDAVITDDNSLEKLTSVQDPTLEI